MEPRLKWNKITFRILQCVLRCVLCCPVVVCGGMRWYAVVCRFQTYPFSIDGVSTTVISYFILNKKYPWIGEYLTQVSPVVTGGQDCWTSWTVTPLHVTALATPTLHRVTLEELNKQWKLLSGWCFFQVRRLSRRRFQHATRQSLSATESQWLVLKVHNCKLIFHVFWSLAAYSVPYSAR